VLLLRVQVFLWIVICMLTAQHPYGSGKARQRTTVQTSYDSTCSEHGLL